MDAGGSGAGGEGTGAGGGRSRTGKGQAAAMKPSARADQLEREILKRRILIAEACCSVSKAMLVLSRRSGTLTVVEWGMVFRRILKKMGETE